MGIGKLLSSHGANVSAVDQRGQTPLHRAAAFGNFFSIRFYLTLRVISLKIQVIREQGLPD